MSTSQSATDGAAAATGATSSMSITTAAIPLLGKRKEPQLPPPVPSSSSSSPTNVVVDEAFKRLFGYSWGTTFDLPTNNSNASAPSSVERQMIQIFGPARTARILNLPWDIVAPLSAGSNTVYADDDYFNPAAMLTTKIVANGAAKISTPVVSSSAATTLRNDSLTRTSKKNAVGRKRL